MSARFLGLVLAAGKGTRMRSDRAKVLHEIGGRSLLGQVLETASTLGLEETIVVVGHQADEVRAAHAAYDISYALQSPQLGTGHAVICAREPLEAALRRGGDAAHLLVLYGDVPLLRSSTLRELMERHLLERAGVTVLTAELPDPSGYGRVLRGADGKFLRIVEDRDLAPDQRGVREINSGIYTFRLGPLLEALSGLKADNSQREYYLTDTLAIIRATGLPISIFQLADAEEIGGINTPEQLADAEAVLRRRAADGTVDGCELCHLLAQCPELVVERRDGFVLLLAPEPYNCGHFWIAPERHLVSFESLEASEASRWFAMQAEIEQVLSEVYRPEGLNVGWNSGFAGKHLRAEIVPRWTGDSNFMQVVAGVNLLPETLATARERLAAKLAARRSESA